MGEAGETTRDEPRPIADHVDGQPSRSHGTPWRGWIDNGVRLEESEHIRYVDSDVEAGRFWGTEELVGMIERAADRVASIRPGARLTVGELSKKGGGHVRGHRSHESGRDVDLGFYLLNEEGGSVETKWFIPVEPSGHASWGGPVRFDDRRNWLLMESLLTDPQAHVKWVFVAPALRRRLLNEAERRGVDPELYERASRILAPPVPDVNPHNNHFHVRIYCPADDVPDCRDERPYWPWLPASHPFARR